MTHSEKQEPPHDILAADEFGIGTRDERLPPDPSGINEPHDVLAAEEFAMPAGGETQSGRQSPIPEPRTLVPLIVLAAFAALLVLLARRRA